jgi:hypothetical protein
MAVLSSPQFTLKAFPYVDVQVTESGLRRLQDMCRSTLISPYIRNIGINTQAPRHSTICEMRRKLRECPSADPGGILKNVIVLLSDSLAEYQSLCSSGRIVESIQAAFEFLRQNQNGNLTLEIWDDVDRSCFGYQPELDILFMIGDDRDPEGILKTAGIFCLDERNQLRILLALARSGLPLKQLRLSPKTDLVTLPWDNVSKDLREDDNITTSFRCDRLMDIQAESIHIGASLNAELRDRKSRVATHSDSGLKRLLVHTKGLNSVSLEGSCYVDGSEACRLLISLPRDPWRHIRMAFFKIETSTFSKFWSIYKRSLGLVELISVELVQGEKRFQVKRTRLHCQSPLDVPYSEEIKQLYRFLSTHDNQEAKFVATE